MSTPGPELLQQAWVQAYLDPLAAHALGKLLVELGEPWQADGWLHIGLAEVRTGDNAVAASAVAQARQAWLAAGNATGVALADDVRSIVLRRGGDHAASAALQADVDARRGLAPSPQHRFIAHNTRAITAKVLGDNDGALRHFYAALEAAEASGLAGPRITALSNLGGFHQDLYNLDDARQLSERALHEAMLARSRPILGTAASNLIIIHHAAGEPQRARAMVQYLLEREHELLPGALRRHAQPLALGHLGVGEIDEAWRYLEPGAIGALSDVDGETFWAWLRARCLLARGEATQARAVAEQTLQRRGAQQRSDQPYDQMELARALADACEAEGDTRAALQHMRRTHGLYEQLVGRSARARFIALEASHQLAAAQRERDQALDAQRASEGDRQRLADLNAALQRQVAETERLHQQLREQALVDPLTGLHNRRYLFEVGPGLLELARRNGSPLCVVLLDLDHFKLLNDTYGHQAGDAVLQRFGTLLRQMLRKSDVVCRHGGEEFVAVMPEIDAAGAEQMLARLLQAFQQLPPDTGRRRMPAGSFSAGIALFPRHGSTLDQLLSRADRALYAAKHHGRARIEQAPRTGFGTLS